MKNLLIVPIIILSVMSLQAQEAAEKKFLAGLTLGTGLNFNQPQTNKIESRVGADQTAGMVLDWHFLDNIALSTGLEFEFNRFRHSFVDTTYFDYNDKVVLQRGNESSDEFLNTGEGSFMLDQRRYKSIYLTLPVMLRFQTNYMGYLRYFGKFGLRNGFLLRTRGDNEGQHLTESQTELNDMQIPGQLSFYKGSIGLSVGAEWNFTGSTTLVGELGYYYGFTEIHQQNALTGDDDRNKSLYENNTDQKLDRDYFSPSAQQGQLHLKVSILF